MKTEKLIPECKNNLWGGDRLVKEYGKKPKVMPCAESWELSFHPDGLTRINDGRTLAEAAAPSDLGENCAAFSGFPVMVKFIDAKADLSVQVHPDDKTAAKRDSFGKTEMWYAVDADPGAFIYLGFKRAVTAQELEKAAEDGTLTDLLKKYEVKKGDVFFIPAGTVHAIGAGCLMCEIQQNSNITYRLYDYKRKDKNGKERELHIKEAVACADLTVYRERSCGAVCPDGELIGACRYFSAYRLVCVGNKTIKRDKASFKCLTCIEGEGSIDGEPVGTGDSFFVPAGDGGIELSGKMTFIITAVRRYAIGIDLGGTFIKGGIVDDLGNIIVSGKVPTGSEDGAEAVCRRIAGLCEELLQKAGMTSGDVCGIGAGVPGMIDRQCGEVVYSNNLRWEHFMIKDTVQKLTGLDVTVANDANVAALGEARFGAGRGLADIVMLTLGTGVGGGIIINGTLYEGNRSAGAELGHMVMIKDGELCTCGRRGCIEAYASATGLIRDTKRAMKAHPDSKMNEISMDKVDGKTAFLYENEDVYAKQVVEDYLGYIACGVADICNVFRPEAVIIGGGIGSEGKKMTDRIQKKADPDVFGGDMGPYVPVIPAALGNSAGLLGAAALVLY